MLKNNRTPSIPPSHRPRALCCLRPPSPPAQNRLRPPLASASDRFKRSRAPGSDRPSRPSLCHACGLDFVLPRFGFHALDLRSRPQSHGTTVAHFLCPAGLVGPGRVRLGRHFKRSTRAVTCVPSSSRTIPQSPRQSTHRSIRAKWTPILACVASHLQLH
jgi:hypothetical protein